MVDIIAVCNTALAGIGSRSTITSLSENSPEARNCALFLDNVRTSMLRLANWNFAKAEQTLALYKAAAGTVENPTTTATVWNNTFPPIPWLYSYFLPVDCIKVRYVKPQAALAYSGVPLTSVNMTYGAPVFSGISAPFELAGDKDPALNDIRVLLTNEQQALLTYTKDVTDPNVWDSGFYDLVTAGLSASICLNLTGDKALAKMKLEEVNQATMLARVEDANEGLTVQDRTPESLRIRGVNYTDSVVPGAAMYGNLRGN